MPISATRLQHPRGALAACKGHQQFAAAAWVPVPHSATFRHW